MSQPVRVLLMLDSVTPEAGTENQILNLIRHIDRNRIELFVACLEDGPRLQSVRPFATPLVFPIRRILSFTGIREMLRFRRELARLRIDVVHTFMVRATIFGVLGARFSSCKAIITSRRNLGYWYSPKSLRLFRFLNRFTTRVLANCEGARQAAIRLEGLSPERIDVLYNGVETAPLRRAPDPALRLRLGIPENAAVVGIVANYRPVKNLSMFLQAARLVLDRLPDVYFVLGGRGSEQDSLSRLASDLGIANRIIFTDDLNDVAAFYPLFDVACLCSHSEGFSNAILEYMAAGLPVVATDVGGISEAVEHGKTGFVVPAGDTEAFAKSVLTLLEDAPLRKQMGRAGQQRCAERFDFTIVARQYEDYYERLARSGSK